MLRSYGNMWDNDIAKAIRNVAATPVNVAAQKSIRLVLLRSQKLFP